MILALFALHSMRYNCFVNAIGDQKEKTEWLGFARCLAV